VIEFDYRGPDPTVIWLVLDRGDPSVCIKHPGFDSDLIVTTDPVSFMRVFAGIETLLDAQSRGTVAIAGPPRLSRSFAQWFLWSPFAPAVREAVATQDRK
jgi:hypothetical protein